MFERIDHRLDGLCTLKPLLHRDARGLFYEAWNSEKFRKIGIPHAFVQDNCSVSRQGVLRGLHFQFPKPQAKLVHCIEGEIWDVAVDIRKGSPTFGQWVAQTLSAENRLYFYIPEGFAHGFCTVSTQATVLYKVTEYYHPEHEYTLKWDDPALAIAWPVSAPDLSGKDGQGKALYDLPSDRLIPFESRLL